MQKLRLQCQHSSWLSGTSKGRVGAPGPGQVSVKSLPGQVLCWRTVVALGSCTNNGLGGTMDWEEGSATLGLGQRLSGSLFPYRQREAKGPVPNVNTFYLILSTANTEEILKALEQDY